MYCWGHQEVLLLLPTNNLCLKCLTQPEHIASQAEGSCRQVVTPVKGDMAVKTISICHMSCRGAPRQTGGFRECSSATFHQEGEKMAWTLQNGSVLLTDMVVMEGVWLSHSLQRSPVTWTLRCHDCQRGKASHLQ